VTYVLLPEGEGARTRVALTLDFALQGMLAQFSRSGLVRDLVQRLVRDFAANLAAMTGGTAPPPAAPPPLRAGSLVWAILWARLKSLLGFGR
jgi:carbon-monoxide dehydrogenase small subunit